MSLAPLGTRVPRDREARALRVLLADPTGPARQALAALVGELPGVELVGEVGARGEIARALRRWTPDVLLIDDRLVAGGDHALAGIGPMSSHVRVIVVGVDNDPAFAARAHRIGAEAWIVKDRADEELRELLTRR